MDCNRARAVPSWNRNALVSKQNRLWDACSAWGWVCEVGDLHEALSALQAWRMEVDLRMKN